jgi:hypothetical protein
MVATAALLALPSTFGATIIQANAFNVPAGDYVPISWNTAQRRANQVGRELFYAFPGQANEDPNTLFYSRSDVTGVNSAAKTIVAVKVTSRMTTHPSIRTTDMTKQSVEAGSLIERVDAWHYEQTTLTNTSTYTKPVWVSMGMEELTDPESSGVALLPITNGYQRLYEAMCFILKQNAGAAPTLEPFQNAISGLTPF